MLSFTTEHSVGEGSDPAERTGRAKEREEPSFPASEGVLCVCVCVCVCVHVHVYLYI